MSNWKKNNKKFLIKYRQIIRKKLFLNHLYRDFYKDMLNIHFYSGSVIELGSGAGFIKQVSNKVITSDIFFGPDIDKVFKAEKMPFKNNSVAGFVMLDVFHHVKDVNKALKEIERCLKCKGKVVMIEPYISHWGSIVYKYLHHENYDPLASWRILSTNKLVSANTALPWIVFKRDRKIFEKELPKLKILQIRPHTPFRYLISGGLTRFQLLPSFCYSSVKMFEKIISPLNKYIGMFVTIEIEKQIA